MFKFIIIIIIIIGYNFKKEIILSKLSKCISQRKVRFAIVTSFVLNVCIWVIFACLFQTNKYGKNETHLSTCLEDDVENGGIKKWKGEGLSITVPKEDSKTNTFDTRYHLLFIHLLKREIYRTYSSIQKFLAIL